MYIIDKRELSSLKLIEEKESISVAFPRVFVSSTCYDLSEIRDNLVTFIKSYYFEPILSERGDVFYHPDLHTHISCVNEIQNCQLFILIIGGRFGGSYIADTTKSIVNAEYLAAKENDIPVFCFIKREVFEDHRVYSKNKKDIELVKRIEFPSVEKQEYASSIFRFIDEVRHSNVNNGIFTFEFAREIQDTLGKQWAGMFCDFLSKRKLQKQFDITTNLLSQLAIASDKTEEIIKKIYLNLNEDEAKNTISTLDEEAEAKQFFEKIKKTFHLEGLYIEDIDEFLMIDEDKNWVDFLLLTGDFYLEDCFGTDEEGNSAEDEVMFYYGGGGIAISDLNTGEYYENFNKYDELFNKFKRLNKQQKKKILMSYSRQ